MKRSPLAHDQVFIGSFAERYARKHQKVAVKFGHEVAGKLAQRGFRAGRILDVGCGFGATAIVLAQAFPRSEVVGIDLSEPLLEMAVETARSAGLAGRVRFEKADVQKLPYDDRSFDGLLNIQMLHIVQDPVAMLDEMERVLAPDGVLFMADIRRSWVGLFDPVFKSALTVEEAGTLAHRSKLRQGIFSSDLLWWRYCV